IADAFHNMGTSLAKRRHFFHSQRTLPPRSASRFAYTELEYLVMLTRTVFDLLQEMISLLWANHVQLLDQQAENRRLSRKLPTTFSRLVLRDKQEPRSADEIETEFGLTKMLAEEYAGVTYFLSMLCEFHDCVIIVGIVDSR